MSAPLLELRGVGKRHPSGSGAAALWSSDRRWQTVLEPTDLSIPEGAAVGLVGESGSGKTTLARIAAGLTPPSMGHVRWQGMRMEMFAREERLRWRREVQYVFQNPGAALNPRHRVQRILAGALSGLKRGCDPPLDRAASQRRISEVCELVGIGDGLVRRFPHQLSGGQAQRVAIARAVLGAPRLLILDEPVSALDLSLQAQILNLLAELRREMGLTYLFISHDLAVVERLCEQVCVMRAGSLVERGDTGSVLRAAKHPYTRRLLDSVPRLPESRTQLE